MPDLVRKYYTTVHCTALHCSALICTALHNIVYSMAVTGTFRKPLDRQIAEKVQISKFKGNILMNRKSELGGAVVEREQYKYRRWGAGR
jgi:hypothetical protein